jgi:hypothetical protein
MIELLLQIRNQKSLSEAGHKFCRDHQAHEASKQENVDAGLYCQPDVSTQDLPLGNMGNPTGQWQAEDPRIISLFPFAQKA